MLEVRGLETFYGGIRALKGVDLSVPEGSIVSIVGANGAGKTTLLKTIAGVLAPRAGRIDFMSEEITGMRADRVARRGISLVPEGRAILSRMTVLENLEMGAYPRTDGGVADDLERVMERFPALKGRRRQPGGLLSGGEQQMLALGRALMARPRLLLLDEPSLGLAPLVVSEIFRIIRQINREEGTTILLVEQNVMQSLAVSREAYVLETGRIALRGESAVLLSDPRVRDAYLGKR
jgi:branched-chain amino acid transport system ATP-binding protein